MKFTLATVAALLAALVEARPSFTNTAFPVTAGQPFPLTWTNAVGAVEIVLNKETSPGSGVFNPAQTLASGITANTVSVTIDPASISSGLYTFSIKDTSDPEPNYSVGFQLAGTGSASSSSGTVASTSSAPSSTSSPTLIASTSTTASTSAPSSATAAQNSTSSAPTRSRTSTSATGASTTSPTPSNLNAGGKLQSSLALVFVGLAAYAFLN